MTSNKQKYLFDSNIIIELCKMYEENPFTMLDCNEYYIAQSMIDEKTVYEEENGKRSEEPTEKVEFSDEQRIMDKLGIKPSNLPLLCGSKAFLDRGVDFRKSDVANFIIPAMHNIYGSKGEPKYTDAELMELKKAGTFRMHEHCGRKQTSKPSAIEYYHRLISAIKRKPETLKEAKKRASKIPDFDKYSTLKFDEVTNTYKMLPIDMSKPTPQWLMPYVDVFNSAGGKQTHWNDYAIAAAAFDIDTIFVTNDDKLLKSIVVLNANGDKFKLKLWQESRNTKSIEDFIVR